MAKFYFLLTDGLTKVADSSGQFFEDAASAREHASACTEAFSRRVAQFNRLEGLPWTVQVMDEHDRQVFTLKLRQPTRARSRSNA